MCCVFILFDVYLVQMYAWAFLLFHLLGENCEASSELNENYYECGAHGRFEYCINGIPGCVVGCHCHPGYYFDTDTKICEPNVKLTQDYRRHYNLEPTRLPMTFTSVANGPTPTTANPIDDKVDEIAKDADDLGDWLYNQFFKTIENQVVNSTDDGKITRRSGIQAAKPIPKILRRSRKKGNKKLKKKKFIKKGLRRKLLRITEDDSLFDSSSGSTSSESSSSSDSDTSFETDNNDKDHGHRKILMINKKPTPQLPSFIFLPNVETPFYPPIGLPPPPIVPMYPMVPVPPVGPYYPGNTVYQVTCNDSETTSAPTTTITTTNTNAEVTTTVTTTDSPSVDPDPDPDPDADVPASRTKSNQPNKKAKKANKHGERLKVMQKLREKMKKRNKQPPPTNFDFNFQDPETSFLNNPESMVPEFRSNDMYNPLPPIEDVDFKYLSQLIHKIDLNKTKPSVPFNPRQRMVDLPNTPFRRNNQNTPPIVNYGATQKLRPASKADDMNNSYYTNLGRQIASLIRKVDTDGDRQIKIEIEQQNKDPMQTVFNENRFAPRSYWERFVRSPLKHSESYVEEMNHLKNSNENLFNLEDQVNVAAASGRSLSLHELENIANVMERTQSKSGQKSSKNVFPTTSSRSYNINLLPRMHRRANIERVVEVNGKKDKQDKKPLDKVTPKSILSAFHHNIYPTFNTQNAKILDKHINETHKNPSIPPEIKSKMDFLKYLLNSRQKTPLHHQVSRIVPHYQNITNPEKVITYQPLKLNFNNMKYVSSHHNPYQVQRIFSPFQIPLFSKALSPSQTIGRNGRPSYFRHEFHHFDNNFD